MRTLLIGVVAFVAVVWLVTAYTNVPRGSSDPVCWRLPFPCFANYR